MFLGYEAGVKGAGEVLSHMNTKELSGLDLHMEAVDVQNRVGNNQHQVNSNR